MTLNTVPLTETWRVGGIHEQTVALRLAGGANDDATCRRSTAAPSERPLTASSARSFISPGCRPPGSGWRRRPGRCAPPVSGIVAPAATGWTRPSRTVNRCPFTVSTTAVAPARSANRIQVEEQRDGQSQGRTAAAARASAARGPLAGGPAGPRPARPIARPPCGRGRNCAGGLQPARGGQPKTPVPIGEISRRKSAQLRMRASSAMAAGAAACARLLPDPRGGGGEFGRVRHVYACMASIRSSSFGLQVFMVVLLFQAACLSGDGGGRAEVTATTPHEMPSIRPISLLVYSSTWRRTKISAARGLSRAMARPGGLPVRLGRSLRRAAAGQVARTGHRLQRRAAAARAGGSSDRFTAARWRYGPGSCTRVRAGLPFHEPEKQAVQHVLGVAHVPGDRNAVRRIMALMVPVEPVDVGREAGEEGGRGCGMFVLPSGVSWGKTAERWIY